MARPGRSGRKINNQPSTTSSNRSTPSASEAGSSNHGAGYFAQFGFQQDPDAEFLTNFRRLAINQGWSKKEFKARRPEALEAEFDLHMGTDMSKLEAWQQMCNDCLIEPVPSSITQCKKALEKVHVNIYNYLDYLRDPERFSLRLFPSVSALRKYSVPNRIYPLRRAKADTFLKALLRPFF